MIKIKKHIGLILLLMMSFVGLNGYAQMNDSASVLSPADSAIIRKIDNMTKDDIKKLTMEDLLAIPLEYLVKLSQKLGISVEELLNMKVTVSSKNELTPRESPGIISVITEEEIKKSGARDLIDVLKMVPGYNFGYDVQGVIGLSSRGLWGHEGKILLLMDGQEMNEQYYSTIPISNHYPINNIKRIEIIRGPGSSIYGGSAELGVINIITKTGDDLNGGSASVNYGQMGNIMGRTNANFAIGQKYKDLDVSLNGYYSIANKTNKTFQLPDTLVSYADGSSKTENENINFKIRYKKLQSTLIYDNYQTGYYSYFLNKTASVYHASHQFNTFIYDLRYDFQPIKKLTITPRINYKYGQPWVSQSFPVKKSVKQVTVSLLAKYDMNDQVKLLAGAEYILNEGHLYGVSNPVFMYNQSPFVTTYSQGYFFQATAHTDLFNITLGGRYDIFGIVKEIEYPMVYAPFYNAFAPRIAITKVYNKFHYKVLISKAFRSPSVGMLNSIDIAADSSKYIRQPENTYIQEIEMGYKINKKIFLTCNLFNVNINNPLVFVNGSYYNWKQIGTMGAEFEFRYRVEKGYLTLNYSYYHSGSLVFFRSKNGGKSKFVSYDTSEVYAYQRINSREQLLGFANHKITLNSCYYVTKHVSVSNAFIFTSAASALVPVVAGYDTLGNEIIQSQIKKIKPNLLWNIFVEYTDLMPGMNIGLGLYNVFDYRLDYVQPYMGFSSPFPGPGREIMVRLTYDFSFRKDE